MIAWASDPVAAGAAAGPTAAGAAAGAAATAGLAPVVTGVAPEAAAMRMVLPPDVTSSSPIPVLCTRSINRRSSASSKPPDRVPLALSAPGAPRLTGLAAPPRRPPELRGPLGPGMGEVAGQGPEPQQVAVHAEALDDPQSGA